VLARDASVAAAEAVAELIGGVLGWTSDEHAASVQTYRDDIERERKALELAAPTGTERDRQPGWVPGVRQPGSPKQP
jgi:hypothetical protein